MLIIHLNKTIVLIDSSSGVDNMLVKLLDWSFGCKR